MCRNTAVIIKRKLSDGNLFGLYIIPEASLLSDHATLYNVRTNLGIMWNVLTTRLWYFPGGVFCYFISCSDHVFSEGKQVSLVNKDLMDESWIWVSERYGPYGLKLLEAIWTVSLPFSLFLSLNDQSSSKSTRTSSSLSFTSPRANSTSEARIRQSMIFLIDIQKMATTSTMLWHGEQQTTISLNNTDVFMQRRRVD